MDPLKGVCETRFNFSSKIANLLCSNSFFQQGFQKLKFYVSGLNIYAFGRARVSKLKFNVLV